MDMGIKKNTLALPLSFCCVPQSARVTRSWHNRPASFVSSAESDMVHHDLSPDKMCQCHELSFVARVYLKGAQSFLEGIVTQINIVFLCEFVCTRVTLCICRDTGENVMASVQ